ncbi:MAG: AMP-binding protein [Bacteroidetes bacterium]|jgi:long-chain acyl-CoA synthetase|nr:AMP-binding protein [Bacteroidota bacterium]
MSSRIYTAPPGTGTLTLGKTLPEMMYDACDRYTHPTALNQPSGDGTWTPYSLDAFRLISEELALGFLDLGLDRGDRVGFYLDSDVYFCLADMGCLLAGIIDVPIYLSSAPEMTQYVLDHAEVKAMCVADVERLNELAELLPELPRIQTIILARKETDDLPSLPDGVTVLTYEDVRDRGARRLREAPEAIGDLRDQIDPHDLATLIYTSGTTGRPKGVMLTHENISFNALTAFSGMKGYRDGPDGEVAVSFLPLTHVFARTLHYGFLYRGTGVYFTTPDDLVRDMGEVHPTAFATVPRVLEKVYAKIQERIDGMEGLQGRIGAWALDLAQQYELGHEPQGLDALKLKLADTLVYGKWRDVMGGRINYVICGGAALNSEIANVFSAAGLTVLQGYGLTETSPVITFNRPDRNRAGTVGEPIPGVEVMIADDGEILTRGPHVMQGYYKNEEKTDEVINAEGWFHTGDIGEFTDEGFLRITDRKKDLFKLSTGKYVMPQPLENQLGVEGLVENAVVVGSGYKFCTALIFPEQEALESFARSVGLDPEMPPDELVEEPQVIARYQELVDKANEDMDHWSTIKRFALIPEHLTIENGLLTPTLKVKRAKVRERYADEIEALYHEPTSSKKRPAKVS